MKPAMHRVQSTGAGEINPPFWAVVLAVVAALLLFLVLKSGFDGLDRVLPPGEPFLPYFIT